LGPIVERFRAIGYEGWVSLELMNPILWRMKPTQVAELGLASLRRLVSTNRTIGGGR
jgi:4-hydroxyphenylpyruvate dioxygenase